MINFDDVTKTHEINSWRFWIWKKLITSTNGGTKAAANERNKEGVFTNCVLFTDCISRINNTEIDNAKDIDVVMNMYNLVEYSENYSQTSGSLWLYYRDQPAFDSNNKYY